MGHINIHEVGDRVAAQGRAGRGKRLQHRRHRVESAEQQIQHEKAVEEEEPQHRNPVQLAILYTVRHAVH